MDSQLGQPDGTPDSENIMIPFLSSFDVYFAAGGVAGLLGLAGAVFAFARVQKPAHKLVLVDVGVEPIASPQSSVTVSA